MEAGQRLGWNCRAGAMIVFIGGMQRSGSTYIFNIARELLERDGTVYQEANDDLVGVITHGAGWDHILLKAHTTADFLTALTRQKAVRAICSIRRIEEAIASWRDTFGFDMDTTIGHFKAWCEMYEQIRPYALTIPYPLIDANPGAAAVLVADFLFPGVPQSVVLPLAEKYSKSNIAEISSNLDKDKANVRDIGFSFYDVRTFFHRRHVSSMSPRDPAQHLSAIDLARIRREFSAEIRAFEPLLSSD
jgi:hypothetical protein